MKVDFKKIKKLLDYIDIDEKTEYDTLDFNEKSNITYVFGVNGSCKSTICNILNNEYCNKDIELFSYDKNIYISSDGIIINNNIKEINLLKNELMNEHSLEVTKIINDLNNLAIFSTSNIVKNFITDDDIYFSNLCYNKKIKKPQSDFNEFIKWYITDENKLNIYKEIILNNKNKKLNYHTIINENIDKKKMKKIEDLIEDLNLIYKDEKNIFKNFLSKAEPNINLKFINDIINFLELNEWNTDKCPICDGPVDLNKIISNFKEKFDKRIGLINNNNLLKDVNNIFDDMGEWESTSFDEIKKDLNNFLTYSTFDIFMKNLKRLINNLKEFCTHFFATIEYIKYLILEKYYICEENIITRFDFLDKLKKIKILEKDKTIFSKEMVDFVEFLVSQTIGDNRLKISIIDGDILIDDNIIDDNIKLSTGEKNFVYLAFSLLIYANNITDNKILLIDDPASSLDNNNKFNIIYLINYFANKFENFKTIVFTHNIDILNIQFLCKLTRKESKLYLLKNNRNLFHNDEKTGFIEIKFKDINFLALRKIRKFVIDEIKKNEINDNFCIENVLTFTMLLPIMRAFLYINDDENVNIISEIMHYKKNILSLQQDKQLTDAFMNFYKINNTEAELILKHVLLFINDFNEKEYYDNTLDFKLFRSSKGAPSELIFESMRRMVNMYFIRIFVEKKVHYSNNEKKSSEKWSLRDFIDASELNDADKWMLKCKRLLFNHYMHLENIPNLILPALEISCKNELMDINAILKVFGKESIWVNHN